jgi:hypothetical protein
MTPPPTLDYRGRPDSTGINVTRGRNTNKRETNAKENASGNDFQYLHQNHLYKSLHYHTGP